jgi:probable rRNA maturation factor
VLSFPIDELDELDAGVPRQLGDVTICTAWVERQVADGTSMVPAGPGQGGDATLDAALRRCVVHGLLHLLGMDHEAGEAHAEEMFAAEERILAGYSVVDGHPPQPRGALNPVRPN